MFKSGASASNSQPRDSSALSANIDYIVGEGWMHQMLSRVDAVLFVTTNNTIFLKNRYAC